MRSDATRFKLPPVTLNGDGIPRMVGFELEFSGIDLDQTMSALLSSIGGILRSTTAAERVLRIDPLGDFKIELDWEYLKREAAEQEEGNSGWVDTLSHAAALLVPIEVVCPPVPITDLASLEPMVVALREAGAVGTEESLLAAYGLHINVEIPHLDAATLNAYLTAFALLQWWLVEANEVDVTRKASFYIDLYSETYVKQVLSRPTPTMDEIFANYLEHNANRNRALDLLPLLAVIDSDRVRSAIDDPRIKSRPTFHYRLPNCQIERPDWSLASAWNIWWVVEQLAHRPNDLNDLSAAFLAADRPILGVSRSGWVAFIDQWLKDHALA